MATIVDPVTTTLTPASENASEVPASGVVPGPPASLPTVGDHLGFLRRLRPGRPLYALFILLLGLYNGCNAAIAFRRMGPVAEIWKPFVWEFSSVLVIGFLIPLVVRLEDRVRIDSRPRLRAFITHIGAGIAFSVVHTTGMVLLRKLAYALAGHSYQFGNLFVEGFYELQKDLLTYLSILLIVFAVREFRVRRAGELRAQQLAAELSEARLRHLTAQIEPHFLFNALNAISNRMHEDVEAADRMISQLGDLLRAAYESDDTVLVPLVRELGWLRGYAAMMAERFRGELTFEIEVDPEIEALRVPRLLLQPLVENAIRHGLKGGHGWLKVEVHRTGDALQYNVSDDGIGMPEKPLERGTGLSNISRRLELLFPDSHELRFGSRDPHGAVVSIRFPVSA